MNRNRIRFVSALGLCILAMFMLGSSEEASAGTMNFGSSFPDEERVDPSEEMVFRINVSFSGSSSLDELWVYFGNDEAFDITAGGCEDCGWDGDNPNDGTYTTPVMLLSASDALDVEDYGVETIKYGFKAKFDGSSTFNAFWPGTSDADFNTSATTVNTLPVMSGDAAVNPNPGMPYDTFTVSVTYTDADNHDGTISATVCETSALENCQASFNLDKGVGDNSGGVVYSQTFTTEYGGDDITVTLNATDGFHFALLERTATFEIDTDKPWLRDSAVSATSAGEDDNITFSVVYCVFDVTNSGAIVVNVDIGGATHEMDRELDGSNSDCLNGINYNITVKVGWSVDDQTVTFSASNDNDTAGNLVHPETITINDAPTLVAGTAERVGDDFIINVTAEDVNIDEDAADAITVNATIQYGSTYAMSLDEATGNYTVTVAQADIIDERGGSRVITFEATDLHLQSTPEDFGNAVTIDVDTTSAFTLTASTTAATLTPGVHTVSFNIENNGNHEDRFTISVDSVNGWITSSPSEPVLVGYDSDEDFTITVTVPEVAAGTIDSWTVSAVAENVNTETDSEAGTTTVGAVSGREVSIGTSSSNADPGATVTYYFTVTNTGNTA
ncbi:MAG: hypothetical protein ACJZ2N_00275, partial [Candidatus Poseidoniales archaeon]